MKSMKQPRSTPLFNRLHRAFVFLLPFGLLQASTALSASSPPPPCAEVAGVVDKAADAIEDRVEISAGKKSRLQKATEIFQRTGEVPSYCPERLKDEESLQKQRLYSWMKKLFRKDPEQWDKAMDPVFKAALIKKRDEMHARDRMTKAQKIFLEEGTIPMQGATDAEGQNLYAWKKELYQTDPATWSDEMDAAFKTALVNDRNRILGRPQKLSWDDRFKSFADHFFRTGKLPVHNAIDREEQNNYQWMKKLLAKHHDTWPTMDTRLRIALIERAKEMHADSPLVRITRNYKEGLGLPEHDMEGLFQNDYRWMTRELFQVDPKDWLTKWPDMEPGMKVVFEARLQKLLKKRPRAPK